MTWLVSSLISAVCLRFYDIAKKAALRDNAVLPVLLLSSLAGLGLLMLQWAGSASGAFGLIPLEPIALNARQHLAVALVEPGQRQLGLQLPRDR